jgi:transposase
MVKAYSEDLCEKVMRAIELDGMPIIEASEVFDVARSTIYRWKHRKIETGSLKAKKRKGAEGIIQDWEQFRIFVEEHKDSTQEEMAELWNQTISARTISRALKKIGFTRKKKTYGYRERDEEARKEFIQKRGNARNPHLIYVDQSGMDPRDENNDYGYGKAGERVHDLKSGRRGERINLMAGYRGDELIAPLMFRGGCNRDVFEKWLEKFLVPEIKPGDIVILDNATFHHGGWVREIIESAGGQLMYLPPYSPDLNRIEKRWASLKKKIRKQRKYYDSLWDTIEAVFAEAVS